MSLEVLPLQQIDHVVNVGRQIDVLRQQMRAVGEARQGRRVDLVPLALKQVDDAAPAPAAVPGAVNQHERLLGSLSLRGLR
jgi:hypothetical protein